MVKFVCYFWALVNAKEVFAQADTLLGALKENEAPAPRLLQTSPSAAPSTTAAPSTAKPTTTTLGTPLPCPRAPNLGETVPNPRDVPLGSGTYSISSDLICGLLAFAPDYSYYVVSAGSNVVINIPAEGVSIRALIIAVAGGSVKIRGGPITYDGSSYATFLQAFATPFFVWDGGLLTINSDVVYTANPQRMIVSGASYQGPNTVARAGGTIAFGGTASFTHNFSTCNSSSNCKGTAASLEEGASLTFKKKAEFKFNTTPTTSFSSGAAIYVKNSAMVFEGTVVFESNKAFRGGALYINASTVQFKGSATFKNNNALTNGGALYNSGSTVSFAKTAKFDGNVASSTVIPNGGAVYNFVSITTPAVSAVTKFCVLPTGTDVVDGTKFSCSGCETTIAC